MAYNEITTTATQWTRSGHIRINNPLPGQGTPSITFEEQICTQVGDLITSQASAAGPNGLVVAFDPTQSFPLLNPLDNSPLGTTATHTDFQVMLYSLYMNAAAARDVAAAAAAQAAAAAAQAIAFAAANPTPRLTLANTVQNESLTVGATAINTATSSLMGGAYGQISYSSSDPTVATVDATTGEVTALTVGNAIITATQAAILNSNAAATTSYMVMVTPPPVPVLSFPAAGPLTLTVNETVQNSAQSTLSGSPYGGITYVSSDDSIATVATDGTVIAIKAGDAVITATQAAVTGVNAGASATFNVHVNSL